MRRPGADRGQPDDRPRRPSAPAGRSRRTAGASGPGSEAPRRPGRQAHRRGWRRQRGRRRFAAGLLRRARRRSPARRGDSGQAEDRRVRARARRGEAEGRERVQDRRPVGGARRHPAQGDRRVLLHPGRPRAGDAARPRDPAAGARLAAAQPREAVARRPRRAPEELPRRRRRARMGRDPGRTGPRGEVVAVGRAAEDGQPLHVHPRDAEHPGHRGRKDRRRRQGAGRGTAAVRGGLHDRGPDARLDRPLLRGRRRQPRLRHRLVGDTGPQRRACGGRRRTRHAGREGAHHHLRGLGVLRPERVGPRHRRRGADVATRRPPGPGAVDAPRRARLGPEGPGDRPSVARRSRRRRERSSAGTTRRGFPRSSRRR